ncbi:hypothetical protein POPTR_018G094200v4 [Populus trichocarpa]|uniref:Uncharacterized protein n=1 Tax=Populus trichocarpa TaxID=3694 RepID=A0A3N7G6U2_POPTR|nr:hypothetical protein BDE02_18G076800 [Populus trichocarpa]RQP02900.2 hypothetical protein POPTR_018G094200v4 [Populus trichocarpa]
MDYHLYMYNFFSSSTPQYYKKKLINNSWITMFFYIIFSLFRYLRFGARFENFIWCSSCNYRILTT